MFADRVLSGMRPTGSLHLGHYHGVLKNWVKLQQQYECLFFVADWHALTTHYDTPEIIEQNVSLASNFIHSIQSTGARRTVFIAVDDDTARLARTCAHV